MFYPQIRAAKRDLDTSIHAREMALWDLKQNPTSNRLSQLWYTADQDVQEKLHKLRVWQTAESVFSAQSAA